MSPQCEPSGEDAPCSTGYLSLPDDLQTHTVDSQSPLQPLSSAQSDGPGAGSSGQVKREKRRYRRGKYRGVRERGPGRWVAEIKDSVTGRRRWLGTFPTAEAAALAFDKAVRQIRGHGAKTNFPEGASLSASSPSVVLSTEGARLKVPRGSTSSSGVQEEHREHAPSGSPPRIVLSTSPLIPSVGAGFSLASPVRRGALPVQGPTARPLTSAGVTSSPVSLTYTSGQSMEVDSFSISASLGEAEGAAADELEGVDSFVLPAGSPFLSVEALEDLEIPVLSQTQHYLKVEPGLWSVTEAQAQEAQAQAHPAGPAPERMSSAQCDNFSTLEAAMWQDAERGEDAREAQLPLALLGPSSSISAKPSGALVDSFDRAFGSLLAADVESLAAPSASAASEGPRLPSFSAEAYSSSPVADLGGAWKDVKQFTGLGAPQGLEAGASGNLSLDVIEGLLMNN